MTTITTAGNLTADPELRHTQSGRAVVRFTILENRRRRTADGQGWEDDEPNRFRIQAWGQLAENIAASVHKGDRVHVSGRVITDRWTDKDSGETRTAQRVDADEVAFSLRWNTVTTTKNDRQAGAQAPADEPAATGWDVVDIPEGDTPF
ncbi:single-stranded DNA-binding protein [Microbacterium sp. ZOR0019]|uniref:single-stranded DNA-binding protein n=1 Tax=Microbacterium sp. ZOR0019 TaxID=1339233 RepID=UPI0006911D88|nr:single-stranded DNA-binding protein [Microbacterium sp. ZOR0019]